MTTEWEPYALIINSMSKNTMSTMPSDSVTNAPAQTPLALFVMIPSMQQAPTVSDGEDAEAEPSVRVAVLEVTR